MGLELRLNNYNELPKWYNQYDRVDVVSIDEINSGDYVVVTTHIIGDGNDTHEYTIWSYDTTIKGGYEYINLKELISEWSK